MGIAEELEELRKQGVTSTYATDLKDAEGLSTPEISENVIKAEYKRTRPSNYGKEATEFLRASPTKSSPINPFDDDYISDNEREVEDIVKEEASSTVSEDESASQQQAKDITNLIQITNDFSRVGEQIENDEDDIESNGRMDCFYGNIPQFCPVDSIKSATSSVRGAMNDHVLPTLNEARASINTALDEHVVATVDRIHRQSMETVDGFHQRSLHSIGRAWQQSSRTLDSATAETHRLLEQLQSTSQRGRETFQQRSGEFWESAKEICHRLLNKTTALSAFAPWYMGTAPKWKEFSSSPWSLFEGTLRAYGSVVFCDNPITGLFIWIGILSASPLAAFCSILSVVTVSAWLPCRWNHIRGNCFLRVLCLKHRRSTLPPPISKWIGMLSKVAHLLEMQS